MSNKTILTIAGVVFAIALVVALVWGLWDMFLAVLLGTGAAVSATQLKQTDNKEATQVIKAKTELDETLQDIEKVAEQEKKKSKGNTLQERKESLLDDLDEI